MRGKEKLLGHSRTPESSSFQNVRREVNNLWSDMLNLFLPEGYAVAYKHKEMWSPPPRHVLIQLAPVQLEYQSPQMTTRTRPFSPQSEWRDLKWEFLTGGRLT
jgi:hypothetical protein